MSKTKNLGALWKDDETGFISGVLDIEALGEVRDYVNGGKLRIVVFPNNFKKGNARRPDFNIVLSIPKEKEEPKKEKPKSIFD